MKKFLAAILFLSIGFSVVSPSFAAENQGSTAIFNTPEAQIEIQCENSQELIASARTPLLKIGEPYKVVDVEVKENGIFVHTIHVDPCLNVIQYLDASSNIIKQDIMSDIVSISEQPQSNVSNQAYEIGVCQARAARFTDMIEYLGNRGTVYDGGFASTNLEMISNAIKTYFGI